MRRVAILVENLPVPLDRRVWQEATALRDSGWAVAVIGPRGRPAMRRRTRADRRDRCASIPAASRDRPSWVPCRVPTLHAVRSLALLLRVRAQGRVDVIHGCNPPDLSGSWGDWEECGAPATCSISTTQTRSSAGRSSARGASRGRLLHALTTWLERTSYATASLVISPNDSYAEARRASSGRTGSRGWSWVRNAPDVRRYREETRCGIAAAPTSRSGMWASWARRMGWTSSSMRGRRSSGPPASSDSRLELVGDGEAREALEAPGVGTGTRYSVAFHGYLQPDAFVPILAACAVCVSPDPPTPFNDVSTMVKVVDYVVIGRPIVTFDLHETRVVADDAAVVVRPATTAALARAIVDLLRDPERISALRGRVRGPSGGAPARLVRVGREAR